MTNTDLQERATRAHPITLTQVEAIAAQQDMSPADLLLRELRAAA